MAVGKEIRKKIGSVENTQKITSAMQMVAASKMRRTQENMRQGKPYSEKMRQVIGHLANANPEYRHVYMVAREVRRVGYLVVSTDKGLCGGLNVNLFRALVRDMAEGTTRACSAISASSATKRRRFSAPSAATCWLRCRMWGKPRRWRTSSAASR